MKLIDSELVELAKKYGNQDNARDPVVIARYMGSPDDLFKTAR